MVLLTAAMTENVIWGINFQFVLQLANTRIRVRLHPLKPANI